MNIQTVQTHSKIEQSQTLKGDKNVEYLTRVYQITNPKGVRKFDIYCVTTNMTIITLSTKFMHHDSAFFSIHFSKLTWVIVLK